MLYTVTRSKERVKSENMKLSLIVACSFVLLANDVFSQYLTLNTKKEKDLSSCPYQLVIAQWELRNVRREVNQLNKRLNGKQCCRF
jgi:hypothetical protein